MTSNQTEAASEQNERASEETETTPNIIATEVNKLRFSPKLGIGAEVSTLVKNVRPIAVVKQKFINDYKKKQCNFYVTKLVRRKFDKEEDVYCVSLRFAKATEAPDGAHEFYCRVTVPKLLYSGPPNQYFKSTTAAQSRVEARTAATVDDE